MKPIIWEEWSSVVRAYFQFPLAVCPNPDILSTLCSVVVLPATLGSDSRAAGDWGPLVPFICHGCLPGGVPYSPRLALRVGERQLWVKCLVQEHNVAAAGSDGSSLPTQSHFTATPGDQAFEPPSGFESPTLSITSRARYRLSHHASLQSIKTLPATSRASKGISDRVAQLTIKINSKYHLNIIQAYLPTSSHTNEEVDTVYEEIDNLVNNNKAYYNIVMGDFNAKTGQGNASKLALVPTDWAHATPEVIPWSTSP